MFGVASKHFDVLGLALLGQMDSQYDSVTWLNADYEPFLRLGVPTDICKRGEACLPFRNSDFSHRT